MVRVLYIDDDEGLGRLVQRALAPSGIDVRHVPDSARALAVLDEAEAAGAPFDVVALDHNLGAESGLDVLLLLRGRARPLPVIYVTGSEDARVAVAALKAGAVDYVWKDVAGHYRELLRQSIAQALAQESLRHEKEEAERQVREARDRAELMLHEVNHRVANSLALVASLARLQAQAVADEAAKTALQEMQARINAIAGVHRRLYTSADVRFVELDAYVRGLLAELEAAMGHASHGRVVAPTLEVGTRVTTDRAVALGVVLTELVTNAYKYAYPQPPGGEVRVALERLEGDRVRLTVEDDGIGWDGRGQVAGTGLGSRIIRAMAANLTSNIVYDTSRGGTRAQIEMGLEAER